MRDLKIKISVEKSKKNVDQHLLYVCAWSQENWLLGLPTRLDLNQPAQLLGLARILKFCMYQVSNYTSLKSNNGADQTVGRHRVACTIVVSMQQNQVFLRGAYVALNTYEIMDQRAQLVVNCMLT